MPFVLCPHRYRAQLLARHLVRGDLDGLFPAYVGRNRCAGFWATPRDTTLKHGSWRSGAGGPRSRCGPVSRALGPARCKFSVFPSVNSIRHNGRRLCARSSSFRRFWTESDDSLRLLLFAGRNTGNGSSCRAPSGRPSRDRDIRHGRLHSSRGRSRNTWRPPCANRQCGPHRRAGKVRTCPRFFDIVEFLRLRFCGQVPSWKPHRQTSVSREAGILSHVLSMGLQTGASPSYRGVWNEHDKAW